MSYIAQSMTIADLMHDIQAGKYYLPAIQREFVWPSAKIESLFDSLMRGYPIGVLLRWDVHRPAIHDFQFYELIRDFDVRKTHNIKANLKLREECYGILDGQQRITSLYIGLLGSYIEKLPRLWWGNPNAFPSKQLYINLLYKPDEDSEQRYQIKFLTEHQSQSTQQSYWFLVGDILKYSKKDDLRAFRRSTAHRDSDVFENTLETLWSIIFEQRAISYFQENSQALDEVLEIFVRLNSGGTPLSYSDLLLSLATATWDKHDARKEVYDLVEKLNSSNFNFSKDFVLKTALVFSDSDVRFKAANIRKKAGLETIWSHVGECLKVTALLLRDFGFTWQTLTSANAAIPIAYYIYRRGLSDSYRTQQSYADDRERIRIWLLTMLLGRVFGGQSDRLLTDIRRIIQDTDLSVGFPADAIASYLRVRRNFMFTDERIAALVDETEYGNPAAFMILALLDPSLNVQHTHFHMDHLHPASHFTKNKLAAYGLASADVKFALDHFNRLPNLSLLPGTENIVKSDQPLSIWVNQQSNSALIRSLAMLPDTDLELVGFRTFYEQRRQLLIAGLRTRTGVVPVNALSPDVEIDVADLITGEAVDE